MEARIENSIETSIAITKPILAADIAKIVGLSRSAVTKILRGHTDFAKETIDRVHHVAEELGYDPVAAQKWRAIDSGRSTARTYARLKDVAQRAGVSVSTVRNCLMPEQPYGRYAPETVAMVRQAARELNYVPHLRAKRSTGVPQAPSGVEVPCLPRAVAKKEKMLALRRSGMTNDQIAKALGFSYCTVLTTIGAQPAAFTSESMQLSGRIKAEQAASRKRLAQMMAEAEAQIAVYRAASSEIEAFKAQVEEQEHAAQAAVQSAQEMRKSYEAKVLQFDAKRTDAQRAAKEFGLAL